MIDEKFINPSDRSKRSDGLYTIKTNEFIEITNAEYLDGFKISITFSDNSSKVIDF